MAEGMNFGLKKRNTEGNSESRAPKVVIQGGQTPQILMPMAKQLLKVSRQVAVLRANVLSHYMLRKDMIWIGPVLEAHQKYVQRQQTMPEGEKWKADPIQVELWDVMIRTMTQALREVEDNNSEKQKAQQVEEELNKYIQYMEKEGKKKMGCEVMHLQLKAAYRSEKIKLEAMICPGTNSHVVWTKIICPLMESEGGYVQKGVEPKGDLERKIQTWVDATAPKSN